MANQNQNVSGQTDQKIATISIDDGKVNAFSVNLLNEFSAILGQMQNDRDVKCIVIKGRPGVFSAGFDLKGLTTSTTIARDLLTQGMNLCLQIYLSPKPIVIAATGHTIALAALAVLTADRVIGVEGQFKIGLNETMIGMALPYFGVELARAELNPPWHAPTILDGLLLNPSDAVRAGFFDEVVSSENLQHRLDEVCQHCLKIDSNAYVQTKNRLRGPVADRLKTLVELG